MGPDSLVDIGKLAKSAAPPCPVGIEKSSLPILIAAAPVRDCKALD
jgi:hypothetical protein